MSLLELGGSADIHLPCPLDPVSSGPAESMICLLRLISVTEARTPCMNLHLISKCLVELLKGHNIVPFFYLGLVSDENRVLLGVNTVKFSTFYKTFSFHKNSI